MGKDTREIRREIEDTRARMDDTVDALGYKTDVKARMRDAVDDRVETVKETVSGAVGRVGAALGRSKDRVGGRLDDAQGALSDRMPDVDDLRDKATRAAGIAAENPLGLALGALAVGFLAGLMLPVSEVEARRIAPLGDGLMEKAQSIGGDLVEHGKAAATEVAQATMQAAQTAAQTHGEAVLRNAKETASEGGAL